MKDEKETGKKLQDAAKKEFLEKGFQKASLRNICKNAGVTTGALYFFFRDKDELFESLVMEPVEEVRNLMVEHYRSELEMIDNGGTVKEDFSDDAECTGKIIEKIYQHKEAFELLLMKAQGSKLEGVLDGFVEITEQHYRHLADETSRQLKTRRIGDKMIHWMSHMQIDTFVYMVEHIETAEEAFEYMETVVSYMINGWYGMFQDAVSEHEKQ